MSCKANKICESAEEENEMNKSDVFLMLGSVLITTALIMWETFGLMVTPTLMTVASSICFLSGTMCWIKEENK